LFNILVNSSLFYYALMISSIAASILSFIFGIIYFKHVRDYLVPVFLLCALGSSVDIISLIISESGKNNWYIFHFYTLIEFSLWITFYFLFLKKYSGTYYWFFLQIPALAIVCIIDYKHNGIDSMDSLSTSLESLTLSLLSLLSFLFLLRKGVIKDLSGTPFFYANTAVLLYFLGDLFFFTFSDYVRSTESSSYMALWTIHSLMNITANLLFCVTFKRAVTL
jgi:hypothetical protein